MSIWKKAVSTLATAGLLASLLGTAVAGTALADVSTWTGTGNTYLATCNPTSCTQVADGNTQMQLFGATTGFIFGGYMTVSGASFANASGAYHWDSTAGVLSITAASDGTTPSSAANWISLKSSAAGTAIVSVYKQADIYHAGTLVGSVSVTFYAAGTSGVSASASFAKIVVPGALGDAACSTNGYTFDRTSATSGAATPVANPDGILCVFVGSSATSGLASGVGGLSVSASISPVGLLQGNAGQGQAVTLQPGVVPGVYFASVLASGVAGAATITLSTSTLAAGTVALGTQTFTFTGSIASIKTAVFQAAANKSGGTTTQVIRFRAYDAAGNRVTANGVKANVSTGAPFSASTEAGGFTDPSTNGWVDITCNGTEGKGTVTLTWTSTDGLTKVSSDAVTMYCSGMASTFSVAFDKATVAPGGTATLTATAMDAAGQPAAGYEFTGTMPGGANLATGSPAVVSSGVLWINPLVDGDQGDGTTTWSYLAPFTNGVATAAVTDNVKSVSGGYTNLGTKYASITIGAPAAASSLGSALGVTTVGPFTAATKIAALGKYATIKFSGLTAGALVKIWSTTKTAAGTWPAATVLTSRIADANGNIYLYVRSSVAAWKSYSAGAGWTQIRWR